MSQDEADIRRLIEDWAEAVRQKDMAGILRHHAADLVMFDVPPPFMIEGIEAYEHSWTLFYSTSPDPPVFELESLTVTAGEDVAFAVATMRCVVVGEGDLDFRLTTGLREIDGQWTIVHEHHSIPADT
jgi:uncharacterized protein (TIGR02246 family)